MSNKTLSAKDIIYGIDNIIDELCDIRKAAAELQSNQKYDNEHWTKIAAHVAITTFQTRALSQDIQEKKITE